MPEIQVVGINDPFIDPSYMEYMLNMTRCMEGSTAKSRTTTIP
jgi:hypothetical protein